MSFSVTFSSDPTFTAQFGADKSINTEFSPYIVVPYVDYYDGDYSVTPSAERQTIPIMGKTARENITIDPIPSNYGLITWNGSVITVT